MEFNEKLQHLRKEQEWTQEQLANKLYVSRTAISKWESGKGYPNLDSLKSIARLFSVSVDDLLSGEALISLAEIENRANIDRLYSLVFGTLDILALSFLFLPLYSRQDADLIRTVSLFANSDTSTVTRAIFWTLPILLAAAGAAQIAARHFAHEKWRRALRTGSVFLHAFGVLAFAATRQPYATALLFLFFMFKVVLFIREDRQRGNRSDSVEQRL